MNGEHDKKILLAHGGGGRLMIQLIRNVIVPKFDNDILNKLSDAAHLDLDSSSICFTTDSYVVKPLFFNGGDIGKLSVCGTINDLAVAGAKPVALSLSLIIEEGFEKETLEKLLTSAAQTAGQAKVPIVTGDTKVVEKGAADGIFINTAGIGAKIPGVNLSAGRIESGDCLIINGTIGDHGMTIMAKREDINLRTPLKSDCACLGGLIMKILETGADIKFMRDPTRGGLAATVNELASLSGFDIELDEKAIPADPAVQAAADILGFDLLNVANEGKVVIVAKSESKDRIIQACKNHPLGQKAAIIGRVAEGSSNPIVELITNIGGRRIVQMPYGRELPRIC